MLSSHGLRAKLPQCRHLLTTRSLSTRISSSRAGAETMPGTVLKDAPQYEIIVAAAEAVRLASTLCQVRSADEAECLRRLWAYPQLHQLSQSASAFILRTHLTRYIARPRSGRRRGQRARAPRRPTARVVPLCARVCLLRRLFSGSSRQVRRPTKTMPVQ